MNSKKQTIVYEVERKKDEEEQKMEKFHGKINKREDEGRIREYVSLNSEIGRRWLLRLEKERRVAQHVGILLFDKDLAKKDRGEIKEKPEGWITETLQKACEGSGHQLRRIKDNYYTVIVEGNDSTRLDYYEKKRLVSISRIKMLNRTQTITYKQVAKTDAEKIKIGSSDETGQEWKEYKIIANDPMSIQWMINVIENGILTDTSMCSELGTKLSSMKYHKLGYKGRFREVGKLAAKTRIQMSVVRRGKELIHRAGNSNKWHIIHLAEQDIYIFKKRINGGDKDGKETIRVNAPGKIFEGSIEHELLRKLCRGHKGEEYPSEDVKSRFVRYNDSLEMRESKYDGKGVHTRGAKLMKGEVIGVYGGKFTKKEGQYVLDLKSQNRWVDADPDLGGDSLFGRMNQDLHKGRNKIKLAEDGFIIVTEDCQNEELFTNYGPSYNWDFLKQRALNGLQEEMKNLFPNMCDWIPSEWSNLRGKKGRLGWIRRLIEGKTMNNETHGVKGWEGREDIKAIICYLTYGPTTVKFNYRHYGQENDLGSEDATSKTQVEGWDGEKFKTLGPETIFGINGNSKAKELLNKEEGMKEITLDKTKSPTIKASAGRITLEMKISEKSRKIIMGNLIRCNNEEEIRTTLGEMKVWKVKIKEKTEENCIPSNGWCGYLAIDQIRRESDTPMDMNETEGVGSVLATAQELYAANTSSVRKKWMEYSITKRTPKENLASIIDTLKGWNGWLSKRTLEKPRWMNSKIIYRTCEKWKYSLWGQDSEDTRYLEMRDSPMSLGSVASLSEWRSVLARSMMVGINDHYYVRRGEVSEDFQTAFENASTQVIKWIRENNKNRRQSTNLYEVLNEDEEIAQKDDAQESVHEGETEDKLKVIFWNSNGWDKERCDRIAQVAAEEQVDVICLLDVRMDQGRKKGLKSYESILEKATGRAWKGKMVARPGKKRRCYVGGSLLMTSHRCSDVRYIELMEYGVLNKIEVTWGGKKMEIISTYRPYPNKAKGSLREAMPKVGGGFEERYWDIIRKSTEGKKLIVGGDFNLNKSLMKAKSKELNIKLCELEDGDVTYKSEIGQEHTGACIDHVLTKGVICRVKVTDNGLFLQDHIPIVVEMMIKGKHMEEGTRLKQRNLPMIRAGDNGALRKLDKLIEEKFSGDLDGWTIGTMTMWTVDKSREIASRRNRKDNPNGWSPLCCVMRLKLKLLGVIYKCLIRERNIANVYKLFKDTKRDIVKIKLTEEEEGWMADNAVTREVVEWEEVIKMEVTEQLIAEIKQLKKLTSSKIREELRRIHEGWMMRIQKEADKGKIGMVLKRIIGNQKEFSLETLKAKGGNITDAKEIANKLKEHFGDGFSTNEVERELDQDVSEVTGNEEKFIELARQIFMPTKTAEKIFNGMTDKWICEEGMKESRGLSEYAPTYEEFVGYISKLNPRSAGGPSGLTYLLVQRWNGDIKKKVYEELRTKWEARVVPEGWGDRLMQIIPKIEDPELDDMRPLMLVEVLRKIWMGLIMQKIAEFWRKWSLLDESQNAYLRGKGTHTALSQLINALEGARNFSTSAYVSSFDMSKAFDSVGWKFLIRCLVRLRIPSELAEYMVMIDSTGHVFAKCPFNVELMGVGLDKLHNEGIKFKTMKGIGQGDMPSPLFWVAVLDTLLTGLRGIQSEFKIQDMQGNTFPMNEVAFADDLQTVAATAEELQNKADVVSGWCQLTSIKISHGKMRTYGVHWGAHRGENPPLKIHSLGWIPEEVEMKEDGTMKSLGVKIDMHLSNTIQLKECIDTIRSKGEEIRQVNARTRDKMLAIGYCLRTNVVYRTQHCSWHLEDYEEIEKEYINLVRKVAKLIPGFPERLITADRKDGGMGVISTITAAMERKRIMLLEQVHKGGQAGLAMEGQIERAMRDSGRGGLGLKRNRIWNTLGENATGLTALIRWLKIIGLRVRIGYGVAEEWKTACDVEQDIDKRRELESRGIVLAAELIENGETPIRIGQCWEIDGRITEILGYDGPNIEVMYWDSNGETGIGDKLEVSAEGSYYGYPTGMGGRNKISRDELHNQATHLVELSRDTITEKGEGNLVCQIINKRKMKAITVAEKVPEFLTEKWAQVGVKGTMMMYTDGSYKEEWNWGEFLLGTPRKKAGGAIILSDGAETFHRIEVVMDLDIENANATEVICILIGSEISKANGWTLRLGSDCQAALKTVGGGYSENFYNILAGWKLWGGVETFKVKAHPERRKKYNEWDNDDMGIWIADRVAGGFMEADQKISAKEWINRIALQSKVSIEKEDGTPFIGNVARLASKYSISQYYKERDGWREQDGLFDEFWEGANSAMASNLLRRNGGFEDIVTMVKLTFGKRWDCSRHNTLECKLCGEQFTSQKHPMMLCSDLRMYNARNIWRKSIEDSIKKAPKKLRQLMEEYAREVFHGHGGEYAAVGTYIKPWVNKLNNKYEFIAGELKHMKKLMRTVAWGARTVMREYARLRDSGDKVDNANLRQTGISEHMEKTSNDSEETTIILKDKDSGESTKGKPVQEFNPPLSALKRIERGGKWLVCWEK